MDHDESGAATKAKKPRNWWKIGFFVALFAFEVTREIAVMASDKEVQPNSNFYMTVLDDLVTAEGSWKRLDGGEKLMTSAVNIECWRSKGTCIEAYSNTMDGYVYAPIVDTFDATFGPDAVTYENDLPDCAKYSVRMDFKLKKVFAVRDRKENPSNPNCAKLEKRIEMQLASGYEYHNPADGHFVPVVSILATVIRAFDK